MLSESNRRGQNFRCPPLPSLLYICYNLTIPDYGFRLNSSKKYKISTSRKQIYERFLVCPTGSKPAAFRVRVIRRSSGKPLRPSGFVDFGQIAKFDRKSPEVLQRNASGDFFGSSQIVVRITRQGLHLYMTCTLSLDLPIAQS